MAIEWKQSTALSIYVWMADSTDGKTGKAGLTLAVTLAKYGDTSLSSIAPTVTEVGSGWYKIDLTTTHMNTLGLAGLRATGTGADPCDFPNFANVIAVDKQDAVRMGMSALPNVASGSAGAIPTTGTGANQLAVDGAGNVKADVNKWLAGTIPAVNVTGVPKVDVVDWLGTAPNALASGRVDASAGALAAGVVTAAAIASAALTSAKFDNTVNIQIIRTATAQGAGTGSNQIQLDASASATDAFYNRTKVLIVSGTGAGQSRHVIAYVGSTKTATVNRNWTTNPDATSVFQILPESIPVLTEGLAQAGASTTVTLMSTASAVDDFYTGLWIELVSGTGAGQSRLITGYVGSTKVATVAKAWATNPDSTTGYQAHQGARVEVGSVVAGTIARASFAQDALDLFGDVRRNTAQAGASTTITLDASASASDDRYKNGLIAIVGGTGAGQFRAVTGYVGSTKVATVDRAWDTNPDNTSVFEVFVAGGAASSSGSSSGGGGGSGGTALWTANQPTASKRRLDITIVNSTTGKPADRGTDFMALGIVYIQGVSSPTADVAVGTMTNVRRAFTNTEITAATFTYTADSTTDKLTKTAHGLQTGDGPFVTTNSGGALPGGLSGGLTQYWVVVVDANSFRVATSAANAYANTYIDITSNGSGTNTWIPPAGACLRGLDGIFTYQATQGETNHSSSQTAVVVHGTNYDRALGGGGFAAAAMDPSDTGWDGILEGSVTRDMGLRALVRGEVAKKTLSGATITTRNIADTKNSHHGDVTAAGGRISAVVDDLT